MGLDRSDKILTSSIKRIAIVDLDFRWRSDQAFAIRRAMTNWIAFSIGLIVAAFVALDFVLGLGFTVFLGRKFLDLIRAIAIWR
ncbi:MAG: hypothetical protein ACR2O1_01840 [Boseongicola sp.]